VELAPDCAGDARTDRDTWLNSGRLGALSIPLYSKVRIVSNRFAENEGVMAGTEGYVIELHHDQTGLESVRIHRRSVQRALRTLSAASPIVSTADQATPTCD
jgi:hypothetical protein